MNSKIYNGNVQPNPKEFKIWVDDEGTIRTWNGTEWIEATAGGGSSGSGEANAKYYHIDWDKAVELGYDENDGDLGGFSKNFEGIIYACTLVKAMNKIFPMGLAACTLDSFGPQKAYTDICLIPNTFCIIPDAPLEEFDSIEDIIGASTFPEAIQCFIPITKEQFYNLEA